MPNSDNTPDNQTVVFPPNNGLAPWAAHWSQDEFGQGEYSVELTDTMAVRVPQGEAGPQPLRRFSLVSIHPLRAEDPPAGQEIGVDACKYTRARIHRLPNGRYAPLMCSGSLQGLGTKRRLSVGRMFRQDVDDDLGRGGRERFILCHELPRIAPMVYRTRLCGATPKE